MKLSFVHGLAVGVVAGGLLVFMLTMAGRTCHAWTDAAGAEWSTCVR